MAGVNIKRCGLFNRERQKLGCMIHLGLNMTTTEEMERRPHFNSVHSLESICFQRIENWTGDF